jgi:hypothetical protein
MRSPLGRFSVVVAVALGALAPPANGSVETKSAAALAATSFGTANTARAATHNLGLAQNCVPTQYAALLPYDATGKLVAGQAEVQLLAHSGRVHQNPRSPDSPRTPTVQSTAVAAMTSTATAGQPNVRITWSADRWRRRRRQRAERAEAAAHGAPPAIDGAIQPGEEVSALPPSSPAIESDWIDYPFPLRPGTILRLRLPADLTAEEGERLALLVRSLGR